MNSQAVNINSVVLLGISDQHTRKLNQQSDKHPRIVGGLMGRNLGGKITINASFELAYEIDSTGEIQAIDLEHLEKKVKLIKTDDPYNHFKDDEFVGWYSSTKDAQFQKQDLVIHQQINKTLSKLLAGDEGAGDDNAQEALYVSISLEKNVLKDQNLKEVPLTLYKSAHKKEVLQFEQVPHVVHAEKGEIISIESADKSNAGDKSQFADQLQTSLNAVTRYNEKIEGLLSALDNPAVCKNLTLMRELKDILNAYPQQFQKKFDQQLLEQYIDANLTSLLSAVSATNRLVSDVYSNNSSLKNANSSRFHDMI